MNIMDDHSLPEMLTICTVGTCFTVDDTMELPGIAVEKDDTYQDILDKETKRKISVR